MKIHPVPQLPEGRAYERAYWKNDSGRERPELEEYELRWYGQDVERSFVKFRDHDAAVRYIASDRRGQTVVRDCLLCKRRTRLRLSHVYPAWTGKAHRDEGGMVTGYKSATGSEMFLLQDFSKHYLLCAECEQFISVSEGYVQRLSRGTPADLKRIRAVRGRDGWVEGLDGRMLFRFVASFLLRSHGAASAPHIRLTHQLEQELRNAILDDNFASARHQLSVAKVFTRVRGANPRAHVIRYVDERQGTLRLEALLGGLYFIYFCRSRVGRQSAWDRHPLRQVTEHVAVEPTRARIFPVEMFDLNILKLSHGVPLDAESELAEIDIDGPCLCGWGRGSFEECCQTTWLSGIDDPEYLRLKTRKRQRGSTR